MYRPVDQSGQREIAWRAKLHTPSVSRLATCCQGGHASPRSLSRRRDQGPHWRFPPKALTSHSLDLDDVRLSARKGVLRVVCKGERLREVPIHPQLRRTLADWLQERRDWEGAIEGSALCLNRRGSRLSAGIAERAGLDDRVTAHVLQHSFATTLVRGGTDLVIAAELLGRARLETTRVYTRPSAEDRRKAVELLPVDERGSVLRGELEVSAPRCFEAGAPGVELVAQLGEAVLGEVPGLDPEAGGDQLERSAARVLAT